MVDSRDKDVKSICLGPDCTFSSSCSKKWEFKGGREVGIVESIFEEEDKS